MRLPKFDYVEPKDIKEASSILLDDPRAKILAGGTDLLVNMKHRVELPSVIVNIKRISHLDFIEKQNGAIRIGALATLKSICRNPLIQGKFLALTEAASSVGSYHHQCMGTMGGNLCQQNRCKYFNQSQWWRSSRPLCFKAGGEICHVVNKKGICYSSYSGDVAPVLLALNAKVILEGKAATREIPLEGLFSGDGKVPLNLQGGEILREIIIPQEASDGFSTYMKFANRESIDFPIVGMALWVSMEKRKARVSFTAVDRRPVRAKNVEDFLAGRDLNEETLEQAVDLSSKEATPVKTSLYSPSYKRKIMGLLLKSALKEALRRARR
ncbi:MAG: xanthine dehydrogenase family protein subunit M [Thermodesulfobacteriota bacterium]